MFKSIIQDVRANQSVGFIGARFHHTVCAMAVEVRGDVRRKTKINEVALSGGVWQNQALLELTRADLLRESFSRLYSSANTSQRWRTRTRAGGNCKLFVLSIVEGQRFDCAQREVFFGGILCVLVFQGRSRKFIQKVRSPWARWILAGSKGSMSGICARSKSWGICVDSCRFCDQRAG